MLDSKFIFFEKYFSKYLPNLVKKKEAHPTFRSGAPHLRFLLLSVLLEDGENVVYRPTKVVPFVVGKRCSKRDEDFFSVRGDCCSSRKGLVVMFDIYCPRSQNIGFDYISSFADIGDSLSDREFFGDYAQSHHLLSSSLCYHALRAAARTSTGTAFSRDLKTSSTMLPQKSATS